MSFQALMTLVSVALSLLGLHWAIKLIVSEYYPQQRVVVQVAATRTASSRQVLLSVEWRPHDTRSSCVAHYTH